MATPAGLGFGFVLASPSFGDAIAYRGVVRDRSDHAPAAAPPSLVVAGLLGSIVLSPDSIDLKVRASVTPHSL